MARPKGLPKTGGRKRGTPNKATREWKDFVGALVTDPQVQAKLKKACLEHPELLFRAAEHAVGKPKQQIEAIMNTGYVLPAGDDVAEED